MTACRSFRGGGEFRHARRDLHLIETGPAAGACEVERLAVVAERDAALAEMLESDGEVVGVVRIGGFELERLEVGLLRLAPLRLARVQMTRTTRVALFFLRVYLILLLGLVLVKFLRTFS